MCLHCSLLSPPMRTQWHCRSGITRAVRFANVSHRCALLPCALRTRPHAHAPSHTPHSQWHCAGPLLRQCVPQPRIGAGAPRRANGQGPFRHLCNCIMLAFDQLSAPCPRPSSHNQHAHTHAMHAQLFGVFNAFGSILFSNASAVLTIDVSRYQLFTAQDMDIYRC